MRSAVSPACEALNLPILCPYCGVVRIRRGLLLGAGLLIDVVQWVRKKFS